MLLDGLDKDSASHEISVQGDRCDRHHVLSVRLYMYIKPQWLCTILSILMFVLLMLIFSEMSEPTVSTWTSYMSDPPWSSPYAVRIPNGVALVVEDSAIRVAVHESQRIDQACRVIPHIRIPIEGLGFGDLTG